jgi:hypothetical protein
MTMAVDEYLHPIDIKDSHVLTRVLTEKRPESKIYDVPFAPLYAFRGRKVKVVLRKHFGAGLAPFKADNANTPIVTGAGEIQEQYMELVTIAEKEVLNATDLIALESQDDRIAKLAAETVLDKALRLQLRNSNRTRWMAWQAAKDDLSIAYGDVTIGIDFDLDGDGMNEGRFSASHLPTYAALSDDGYAWNHTTSGTYDADIIEGVYYCAKLIADDLGIDETEVAMHVNSTTWRIIKKNNGIRDELSATNPRITTPKREEVVEILELADVRIRNDHYWDTTATKQKFLPDGYALFTPASYQYNGVPIMEMYDGLVARVMNGQIVVERNPGLIAEMYVNEEQVAQNVRVQTARMPVMNWASAFVYAQVY